MDTTLLKLLRVDDIKVVAPHYNGVHSSIVYTYPGSLNLVKTVSEAMNELCLYFGADLEGRIRGTRQQFKFRKNPPIMISEILQKVALPLPSMICNENCWIIDINFIIEADEQSNFCKLLFDNQLVIEVPLSRRSIERRRDRARHILYEVRNNANGNVYHLSSIRGYEEGLYSVNHSGQGFMIMDSSRVIR